MAFAKIDTAILSSSVWVNRAVRDIFITALLMAKPYQLIEPAPQIKTDNLEETGFIVPPGWYGFVAAAGVGIIHRALLKEKEGYEALRALSQPDPDSRSQEFEGRRLVRINGGYLILNYMKYRDRDSTNAERQQRFRERKQERQRKAIGAATSEKQSRRASNERERMQMRARVGLFIPDTPPVCD